LAFRAWAGSSEVTLEAPKDAVPAGFAVSLRAIERIAGSLTIDGCEPVELERHDGDRWVPVPPLACDGSAPASRMDEELALALPPPPAGEYRAVLVWGTGCAEGLPLVMAGCRRLGSTTSAPFKVLGPAPAAAPATP
jgi:hypothetical protein